jgi:hypothetical protein
VTSGRHTQLTVTLPGPGGLVRLLERSDAHGPSVRWRPGEAWAVVGGAADDVSEAFDVPVRDYRGRKGQVFYASAATRRAGSASRRREFAGPHPRVHTAPHGDAENAANGRAQAGEEDVR